MYIYTYVYICKYIKDRVILLKKKTYVHGDKLKKTERKAENKN
jgi:hypothetical protein